MNTPEPSPAVRKTYFNTLTQWSLPALTILGFGLTSLKLPQYGVIINLIAQIFWIYSGYQAWKKAGQLGIFVTALIITIILAIGLVNYWLL